MFPADRFNHTMLIVDEVTGVVTMNPNIDQWNENLNFESADPNPIVLQLVIGDNGVPPLNTSVTVFVHVVNGTYGMYTTRVCVRLLLCTMSLQATIRRSHTAYNRSLLRKTRCSPMCSSH